MSKRTFQTTNFTYMEKGEYLVIDLTVLQLHLFVVQN